MLHFTSKSPVTAVYSILMVSRSSLSHDFYQVMIGSESMSLLGWKQLALWSLEHSCMDAKEMAAVKKEWSKKWDGFCNWIIAEYGSWPELQDKQEPPAPPSPTKTSHP